MRPRRPVSQRGTLLPDPETHFSNVDQRRVPQLEFGAPIPFIRGITREETGSDLPANGTETLAFDYWEISDDRFFAVNATSGPELTSFDVLQPGHYSISCHVYPANDIVGSLVIALDLFQNGGPGGDAIPFSDSVSHGVSQFADSYVFHNTFDLPPYDPEHLQMDPANLPTSFEVVLSAGQWTGVDDSVRWARFGCYYRGPLFTREYYGA